MIEIVLQKKLGERQLNVNIALTPGQFISLYGASGAGKTSILRMLGGFMKPDAGLIKVKGALFYDSERKINIPPQRRRVGFVFQDYALFPNMNVRENIRFAIPKNESTAIADELLEMTGLAGFAERKIRTLSGGQQQRVALARAIASRPVLLLLDEPLSAVDSEMRAQLGALLQDVHRRFKLTTIMVSHNKEDVNRLSDTVLRLEEGKITTEAPAPLLQGQVTSLDANGKAIITIDAPGHQLQPGDQVKIWLQE